MNWISVEDRLPEEKGYYLVFYWDKHDIAKYEENNWWQYTDERLFITSGVTHWMPLPEPPKE